MIKGIGIDIVEIARIEIQYLERYKKKFLSSKECQEMVGMSSKHAQRYIASRFCAKEAYFKACGTGIISSLREVTVLNDEFGKPYLENIRNTFISISHEEKYCVALVVIEGG